MDALPEIVVEETDDPAVDALTEVVLSHDEVPDLQDGGKTSLLGVLDVGFQECHRHAKYDLNGLVAWKDAQQVLNHVGQGLDNDLRRVL